jgi:putative ABC transport system permease protein
LILMAPTFFIFAAPLLATELFIWLMHPIDRIGRLLPGVAPYLASTNLARAGSQYRAPTYRLILCLALGAFYASVAKSADLWLVDALQHEYGADLTFHVGSTGDELSSAWGEAPAEEEAIPVLPDESYRAVDGVLDATRVSEFEAYLGGATNLPPVRYLAIERLTFPHVAYFRRDYAGESLGSLMNRLGQMPEGLLLPYSLAGQLGLAVGDPVTLNLTPVKDRRLRLDLKVVGFFEHFPTMYPGEQLIVVGNLDYLELDLWDTLPYQMWLKLEPEADARQAADDIRLLGMEVRDERDLLAALAAESSNLERTGVFGLLTLCFLAGAILSVADLLVHSTFMLRERTTVHAVLRALGLQRRHVLNVVILEEIVSVAYGITMGIVCGMAGAILYVPFYRLGRDGGPPGDVPVPPFMPVIDWVRTDTMVLAVALALVLAETLVLLQMTRSRIFEVLRMGQRV